MASETSRTTDFALEYSAVEYGALPPFRVKSHPTEGGTENGI